MEARHGTHVTGHLGMVSVPCLIIVYGNSCALEGHENVIAGYLGTASCNQR